MNNIQNVIIGEQCKRLREAAKISLDLMTQYLKTQIRFLESFELGNESEYGTEMIQKGYMVAISKHVDDIHGFMNKFCEDNNLDSDSFTQSLYNLQADVYIEGSKDKKHLNEIMTSFIYGYNGMRHNVKQVMQNNDTLIERTDKLLESYGQLQHAYEDARQAWHRNADMVDILIDVITMNGLEDPIIEKINEQLELEREHDFGEHEEESYKELIHELNTRWDFLNK